MVIENLGLELPILLGIDGIPDLAHLRRRDAVSLQYALIGHGEGPRCGSAVVAVGFLGPPLQQFVKGILILFALSRPVLGISGLLALLVD